MKLQPSTVWRSGAAILWVISVICLLKAIGDAVTAEESLYNPNLTSADRILIQHLSAVANFWAWAGWGLQLVTALVLTSGIKSERVVRRIFVALGVLIAADGIGLLLMAVIVR